MDCIFCGIIEGAIPSGKVYEDDCLVAFNDAAPRAPVHVLIVPREHIQSAAALTGSHAELLGRIWITLPKIAQKLGLDSFRVITNAGADAGQTVEHLHFHLLGGRTLDMNLG
ncbi:MAG: histidine triad nucleotide-binding protein [Oscillospiraceae bacterium]|nr:histidine triad nucleotide-binding protein [Oscillospiraceae bacterium]